MIAYWLLGAVVFALGCAAARVLAFAPVHPESRWDSATYGEDVSFLDALDFEHRNKP